MCDKLAQMMEFFHPGQGASGWGTRFLNRAQRLTAMLNTTSVRNESETFASSFFHLSASMWSRGLLTLFLSFGALAMAVMKFPN